MTSMTERLAAWDRDTVAASLHVAKLDECLQYRADGTDHGRVAAITRVLQAGGELRPVSVFELTEGGKVRYVLTDGNHRLDAYKANAAQRWGCPPPPYRNNYIPARIYRGRSRAEAMLHASWANASNGVGMSARDRTAAIKRITANKEAMAPFIKGWELDTGAIREALGMPESTVNRWTKEQRAELQAQRDARIRELFNQGKGAASICKEMYGTDTNGPEYSKINRVVRKLLAERLQAQLDTLKPSPPEFGPTADEEKLAAAAVEIQETVDRLLGGFQHIDGTIDPGAFDALVSTLKDAAAAAERLRSANSRAVERYKTKVCGPVVRSMNTAVLGHFEFGRGAEKLNVPEGVYNAEEVWEYKRRGLAYAGAPPGAVAELLWESYKKRRKGAGE